MATFRDLLSKAKSEITEIEPAEAQARIEAGGVLVLDVREPDEFEQGTLPQVLHIPRGHLEAQIEGRATDRDQEIIVYCAGGVRSAFAARTLQELGYTNVLSMAGGFGRWKDEGRPWKLPVQLTPDQRNRYQPVAVNTSSFDCIHCCSFCAVAALTGCSRPLACKCCRQATCGANCCTAACLAGNSSGNAG